MISEEKLDKLGDILSDQKVPLKARNRALFTLKNLGGNSAVKNIARAFNDPSALLKHECAYCLGQMQNETAIPFLINILDNIEEDAMVRHEAGK
jgi:deoxyhypusine monooxygenase